MNTKTMIKSLAMALAALAFAGCGSNNNAAQTAAAQAAAAAAAASQTGLSGATGCIPISNGGFSFTGTGVSINPDAYLLAGTLPATSLTPGTYGTVVMGATSAPSGIGAVQYQPATSINGTLQLYAGSNSVVGTVQLSTQLIQTILYSVNYSNYGYGTSYAPTNTTASTVCVNSIAIQAALTANYNYGYGTGTTNTISTGIVNNALIYLTLSTGATVGPFQF